MKCPRCPKCKSLSVQLRTLERGATCDCQKCHHRWPFTSPAAKRAHALVRRALTIAYNAIGTISAAGWPSKPFPDAVLDAVTAFSIADAAARRALDREEGKE